MKGDFVERVGAGEKQEASTGGTGRKTEE